MLLKNQSISNSKYQNWAGLELAGMILKIFEKYPHDVQNFTALRNIVDFQY